MPISTTAVVENHQATAWLSCVKNRKCNMVNGLQARSRPLVRAENGTSLALSSNLAREGRYVRYLSDRLNATTDRDLRRRCHGRDLARRFTALGLMHRSSRE